MKGLQFIIDDQGRKTAAIIDLKEWGELWEDFYDVMVALSRKNEPDIPWEEVKMELEKKSGQV
jgi:hypothetical protein